VERVVPDTREGVLNLKSAKQVSGSWSGLETTRRRIIGAPARALMTERREVRGGEHRGNRALLNCTEESGDDLASGCRSPISSGGARELGRGSTFGIGRRWASLMRSASQILESWRTRRIIPPEIIDAALVKLDSPRE
jgi:hypothetical protein